MPGLERDQNLAVRRTDRRIVAESKIDALRYADVIQHHCEIGRRNDFADDVFYFREDLFAFFQSRAGRRV